MLAGGQSLVPALNMRVLRPALLVDVNRVAGLDEVVTRTTRYGVGATVRQADRDCSRTRRSRPSSPTSGTRSPATGAPYAARSHMRTPQPSSLLRWSRRGSAVATSTRGRREIPADELFLGPYTTVLEPDELLLETVWPLLDDDEGFAFDELAQRGGDYALCMAAARVRGDELRVVVGP